MKKQFILFLEYPGSPPLHSIVELNEETGLYELPRKGTIPLVYHKTHIEKNPAYWRSFQIQSLNIPIDSYLIDKSISNLPIYQMLETSMEKGVILVNLAALSKEGKVEKIDRFRINVFNQMAHKYQIFDTYEEAVDWRIRNYSIYSIAFLEKKGFLQDAPPGNIEELYNIVKSNLYNHGTKTRF